MQLEGMLPTSHVETPSALVQVLVIYYWRTLAHQQFTATRGPKISYLAENINIAHSFISKM